MVLLAKLSHNRNSCTLFFLVLQEMLSDHCMMNRTVLDEMLPRADFWDPYLYRVDFGIY